MVELLAPAGSYESLQAAVNAGADAVYIGGSLFGARAYADNPDEEHLMRGIEYCHLHGRKLYMTVNTLLKEKELETMLYPFLLPYYRCGVDGVIVQDPGVVRFLREFFPKLEIHASTQMTVTSAYGARLLQNQGITRIVPARELSLGEIQTIIDETGIEVETFIHGAMCYCYSGQCLLSSMIGGRSGNRGRCAQPCRLPYSVSSAPGKSYLLSMKDMCTLELLPELIDTGIASLKIEGRMKRPEYTAGVVSVYRKYIDLYLEKGRGQYKIDGEDRSNLMDLYNRGGFSSGYYETHNGKSMMSMQRPNHQGTKAARVQSAARGKVRAEALEDLHRQDVLEFADGSEITLVQEVRKGERFSFHSDSGRPQQGGVLYRTKNEALLQQLRERYLNINFQEKIKGELRILRDSPAILNLRYLNYTVAVSGDIAEPAMHNSTTEDMVRRQIQKTGNTPFVFGQLDICMDKDLFVSVKGLNELRRRGLLELQENILKSARRGQEPDNEPFSPVAGCRPCKEPHPEIPGQQRELQANIQNGSNCFAGHGRTLYRMNTLVTTPGQLDAVLSFSRPVVDTVYLDSMLFGFQEKLQENYMALEQMINSVKARGFKCFLCFPPVFREMDQKLFNDSRMQELMVKMDGFLLHTLDQLGFAREFCLKTGRKMLLASDDSLYAYNNRAAAFLGEQGICRRTLPSELNFRELLKLDRSGSELNVYGYQALMQSAQCLIKNTSGCRRAPGITYLRDRKNAEFPVLNRCTVCCNTIYNSVPLQLGGCREEITQLAPEFLRLTFTVEDGRQTEHILEQYYWLLFTDTVKEGSLEGTRGHFRRGVE